MVDQKLSKHSLHTDTSAQQSGLKAEPFGHLAKLDITRHVFHVPLSGRNIIINKLNAGQIKKMITDIRVNFVVITALVILPFTFRCLRY